MTSGMVCELRRFSVHDGPGIRTTAFLKGCPLHCDWCHNPECVSRSPEIAFFPKRCAGCGACAAACPNSAMLFSGGSRVFKRELCVACGACAAACAYGALELYGSLWTVEALAEALLEDKAFYESSSGGCSFSGGEPLAQACFCADVMSVLKQEGVSCAIDTSGEASWESFEKVLPYTDIFLFDVKSANPQLHKERTGVSNRRPLENLRRLDERGVPIEIRVPVVPGFNDAPESIDAIGRALTGLRNVVRVLLLPYHSPKSKYEALGRPYALDGIAAPSKDAMRSLAARLGEISGFHALAL